MGLLNIRDLLTAFSPSMDFFAITTGDGRIKIWDTLKGHLQTEFADIMSADTSSIYSKAASGHLSVDYTCMKWMSLDKKRKRKSMSAVLLLGTGSGDVLAMDISVGQLKWRVSDCHPGGVAAISFPTDGSCIYAAGADGMVCKIDPRSGNILGKFKASTKAISSLAVSLDGKLLATAAAQLKIFKCSNEKKFQKFSGHPGAVRCMFFAKDGNHILSSSAGERYVAVWRIDGSKKQSASCVLAMEHPAVFLDCFYSNDGGMDADFYVLAISEIGVCYLWQGTNAEGLRNAKPTKISFSLQDDFSKNHKVARPIIYAAKLLGVAERGAFHVFLACGLLVKPLFLQLSVQFGTDVMLASSQNGVLLPSQSSISKKGQDLQVGITVLDRENAEDALLPVPRIFEVHESKKTLQSFGLGPDKVASDGRLANSLKNGSCKDPADTSGLCMEDRLRSLGIISSKVDWISELTTNFSLFKGINLEDDVPPKMVKATVLSMPSIEAFKLLKVLMSLWHSRSCTGKDVIPWIYSILVNHGNHVESDESASEVLNDLYKSCESKKQALWSLLQLSGRLHLVTAQIGKAVHNKNSSMESHHSNEFEYEDGDDVDELLYGLEDDKSEDSSEDNE